MTRTSRWLRRAAAAVASGLAAAISLTTPAAGDSAAMAARWAGGIPFRGTPAVGALFTDRNGRLTHFCTASVVHSPAGDLLITAAHCLRGRSLSPAGAIVFAPGYHDHVFPYGRWVIRDAFTDSRWRRDRDPDDDFAFLIAGQPGRHIERSTGAQQLATSAVLPAWVQVIGYPDATSRPISCASRARAVTGRHLHQMVFDCAGYTDGTSGSPLLVHVATATGTGSLIGVIGGYQQGGNSPDVSYSPQFLANMTALYKRVTSS
jgi:V8-like Glu-specific endopeptidase